MEIRSAAAVDVFQIVTALERDTKTYLLDIRPQKDFKKKHILQAYSIRLAANGKALLVSSIQRMRGSLCAASAPIVSREMCRCHEPASKAAISICARSGIEPYISSRITPRTNTHTPGAKTAGGTSTLLSMVMPAITKPAKAMVWWPTWQRRTALKASPSSSQGQWG